MERLDTVELQAYARKLARALKHGHVLARALKHPNIHTRANIGKTMAKKRTKSSNPSLTQAARTLGSKGGKKGGPARDRALSDRRKKEIAQMGGKAKARKSGNK